MASFRAFLPRTLLESLARHDIGDALPRADRFEASLLMSDISGFTALTEALQVAGREGAEEIAEVVSAAFLPGIEAIEGHAGTIVSFGGDSLFAVFRGPGPGRRAVAAAEAIRESFLSRGDVRTSIGPVALEVSQAIHHGTVVEMHLGREERRHYLVTGAEVGTLAGQVRGASRLEVTAELEAELRAAEDPGFRIDAAPELADARLVPYLPESLSALLPSFEGGYRRAAVLFLESRGYELGQLQKLFLTLDEVLAAHDGLLLKSDVSVNGTTWLCLFGIPRAHEDDRERAAHAAQEILAAAPPGLLRGGIDEGTLVNVVVGSPSRRSFDVMGDVVNTAARVMGQAAWGEILLTDAMRSALSSARTAARGARPVKGKSGPLSLHALIQASAAPRRMRAGASLHGRDAEMGVLREALEGALAGRGAALAIEGEAGIGKSRLALELGTMAAAAGVEVHEGRASAFGGGSYGAVAELLRHALGLPAGAARSDVLDAVAGEAARLELSAADRHHLAEVLGARYPDSPLAHLGGSATRLNNRIAVRAHLVGRARGRPHLLLLDDMHWADELTREAVAHLCGSIGGCGLLVVLLHRPGYEPPTQARRLVLADLPPVAVAAMLRELHGAASDASWARAVTERAGGNPLYVEELVRHLEEVGGDAMPSSIESLVAARLDRLSPGRRHVVELAAVIGRSFAFDLLASLGEAGAIAAAVEELLDHELVVEREPRPHLVYSWKHALTQEVAYRAILVARRRALHRAVAAGIEATYGPERDAHLAVIGHHRERAGQRRPAMECYLAAGRRAMGRHGLEEAERLFRAYLALVEAPSPEVVAARHDLALRVLRPRGQAHEALAQLTTAVEEARAIGDRPGEIVSLRFLANTTWNMGRRDEARRLLESSLAAASAIGSREGVGAALAELALLEQEEGRIDGSRALFEQALQIHREMGNLGAEGSVLGNLATLEADLGRIEIGLSLAERALAIHRAEGNRLQEALARGNVASLMLELGRHDEALGLYEQVRAVVEELAERRYLGVVLGNMASLLAGRGRTEQARDLYTHALAIHREAGDRRIEGNILTNLASLEGDAGRVDEALALHGEALAIVRDVGNPLQEAVVLYHMAALERIADADPGRALEHAARAAATFEQVGNFLELGMALCVRGHIELARGDDPSASLEGARRAAREGGLEVVAELLGWVARLERAKEAHDAGRPLLLGVAPGDVPPGVLAWLQAHRPEAVATPGQAPPAVR